MKFENRVALVTGSSRGIGQAIACELAREGASIIINNDKKADEGLETVRAIKMMGSNAVYIIADVSNAKETAKMFEMIVGEFGKVDILVNNAGIIHDALFEYMKDEDWYSVVSVILNGTYNCTKHAVGIMKRNMYGRIINISSVVGQIGNIGQANYAAAKAGLIGFTKTIAKEYARYGITSNAICPGFVETSMLKSIPKDVISKIRKQIPIGRFARPEEVAKLATYLASDDASYITGQTFNINGGLYM